MSTERIAQKLRLIAIDGWQREHCNAAADLIESQAAEIAKLREALRPLARAANEFKWVEDKSLEPHEVFLWATHSTKGNDDPKISVSDAFRARAALADGEA